MKEVDAASVRHHDGNATPASVRHDDDEPLTPGGSRASPADGRGRRVAAIEYSAMPCCRPADLPAGARAEVLELHKDSTLIRCPVIERVPFIKKVTPRAPTKPNNTEAG
jgi:hypothetical protein